MPASPGSPGQGWRQAGKPFPTVEIRALPNRGLTQQIAEQESPTRVTPGQAAETIGPGQAGVFVETEGDAGESVFQDEPRQPVRFQHRDPAEALQEALIQGVAAAGPHQYQMVPGGAPAGQPFPDLAMEAGP